MKALRRQVAQGEHIDFFGVGGEQMRAAGCELLVDAREIAEVGIIEVIRHIPNIYRRFRQVVREAERRRPDAAVLIDFPDFNLRLARELHKLGVPVIYYVSPQLWAWKQRRIESVREYVRQMLVIFPFEENYYRERGVEAQFVGHPLADLPAPAVTREDFAREYGLDPARQWIALLPGSRRAEVAQIFPALLEAAQLLGPDYVYTVPVASTLSADWMASLLRGYMRPADHVYARRPLHPAARARGRRRQRNLDARGGADWHALRDGVPGCAAHLEPGPPSSKGGPLRDGEPHRRAGCRARAAAIGLHAAAGAGRTQPDYS